MAKEAGKRAPKTLLSKASSQAQQKFQITAPSCVQKLLLAQQVLENCAGPDGSPC